MKIAVIGASGKTGKVITEEILNNNDLILSGAIISENNDLLGQKIGNIFYSTFSEKIISQSDIVIDFSNHDFTVQVIKSICKHKKPLVIGTTGFNNEQENIIKNYSKLIPILKSANFSLGINLILKILPQMLSSLEDFDIELVETHHKFKKDAPSGTALLILEKIKETFNDVDIVTHERFTSHNPRGKKEIGISSIRGGNIFGEHEVKFLNSDEEISITHKAANRKIFATGAIKAALWLKNKPAGFYKLADLL